MQSFLETVVHIGMYVQVEVSIPQSLQKNLRYTCGLHCPATGKERHLLGFFTIRKYSKSLNIEVYVMRSLTSKSPANPVARHPSPPPKMMPCSVNY
jgi:hypothetical protein